MFYAYRGLTVLVFLFSVFCSYPQNYPANNGQKPNLNSTGIITGTVINSESTKHLEYVYVVLYKSKDSSQVTGAITNDKGKFIFDKVAYGNYYLSFSFVGLKPKKIGNVMVTPKVSIRDMGKVILEPATLNMPTAEISTKREAIEFNLDKKVINVDQNLTGVGGSVVDILQTVPSVTVDIDGGLSLRGSTNVTILIDGRPSGMTGMSRSAILDQIPASSIQSIEVITNPSAKYDPDGMSGIINIILKKKREKGYNGIITVNAGTGNKYNGTLNFNYRKDKLNLFTSYDYRYNERTGYSHMLRESFIIDSSRYTYNDGTNKNKGISHNFRIGADYQINLKNSITMSFLYNNRFNDGFDENTNRDEDSIHRLNSWYVNNESENNKNWSTDYLLNYKRTFAKKGRELTADLAYTHALSNENNDITRWDYSADSVLIPFSPSYQKILSDGINDITTIQVDFTDPFGKDKKYELGYKSIIRSNNNDYRYERKPYSIPDEWIIDSTLSNHFVYSEQIHSLYGTYANNYKNFQFQLGLRLEQTFTTSELLNTNQTFNNDYFSFFPSVHLTQKLSKQNAIQLSYSRRVNRPNYYQLNPFVESSDPKFKHFGNPDLKPEYTNAFEFGHIKTWKKATLTSNVFYKQINDIIQRYVTLDTAGISYATFYNLSKGVSYGLEFMGSVDILKWWKINGNFSYFRNEISGNQEGVELTNSNYTWSTRLYSNMTVLKNLDIQLVFNYRAPMVNIQGTLQKMWNVDLALKKDIFKNKAYITFRISDIFNTQSFNMDRYGNGFTINMDRKRESRIAFLGFTYKLNGGLKTKDKKKPQENMDNNMDFDQ